MGSKILYYCLLLPISHLPFWVLYRVSDFLYLILYKLVSYRTKVVFQNISNSFPNKNEQEVREIASNFYRHFCDLIVESIKAFSISKQEIQKRMINQNADLINQFHEKGKHVIMVGGHYGNWELFAIGIDMELKHSSIALYTPLRNTFFDDKIRNSRSKYGLDMLTINDTKKKIEDNPDTLYAVIFGADQSPRKTQRAYWMKFLNQETGVQFGTEKLAKDLNAAVVFGNIYKQKRGYYEVRYQLITEEAIDTDLGFITKQHTRMLEKDIIDKPQYWLWSHKRWKHQRPNNETLN